MTDFTAWIPPAGAVVQPPVHPETEVVLFFSDDTRWRGKAKWQNWSAEGDGPRVVAYAIVEEYKPAPRDFWIVDECEAYDSLAEAEAGLSQIRSTKQAIIHVREVLPAAREVVAWGVVDQNGHFYQCHNEAYARSFAEDRGYPVVRLSGVMPS